MRQLDLFIVFILIIFLLRKNFTRSFYGFWYLLTRSKRWAMRLTAFFLFLGTLVHELSHFLVATFLGVRTGEFDLMPEIEEEKGIRMGSVKIAKCDFIRRNLIGFAPIFSGCLIIYFLAKLLPDKIGLILKANWWEIVVYLIVAGAIFIISNTMFSSKKDLEVIIPFLIMIAIIYLGFGYFQVSISEKYINFLDKIFGKINNAFLVAIMINVLFLVVVKGVTWFFERILKRRVRFG